MTDPSSRSPAVSATETIEMAAELKRLLHAFFDSLGGSDDHASSAQELRQFLWDNKRGISAALSPTPADRAEIVEECARVCEQWLVGFGAFKPAYVSAQTWATDSIKDIADNIRSLAGRAPESTKSVMLDSTVSSSGMVITIECGSHDTKDAILDLLTGEARSLPAPAPAGEWQWVPKKITGQMEGAFDDALPRRVGAEHPNDRDSPDYRALVRDPDALQRCWTAMLSAAPPPSAQMESGERGET